MIEGLTAGPGGPGGPGTPIPPLGPGGPCTIQYHKEYLNVGNRNNQHSYNITIKYDDVYLMPNPHCKGGKEALLKWHLGVFTARRWHKCIYTAMITIYFNTRGKSGPEQA